MIKKIIIGVFVLGALPVFSQVDSLKIGLDFRTRAELDNGQKTLIAEGKSQSQRPTGLEPD